MIDENQLNNAKKFVDFRSKSTIDRIYRVYFSIHDWQRVDYKTSKKLFEIFRQIELIDRIDLKRTFWEKKIKHDVEKRRAYDLRLNSIKTNKNNKKRQRRTSSQFASKSENTTMKHEKNVEKRRARDQRSNSTEMNRNEKETSTTRVATILFEKRNHLRREHERALKKSSNNKIKSSVN